MADRTPETLDPRVLTLRDPVPPVPAQARPYNYLPSPSEYFMNQEMLSDPYRSSAEIYDSVYSVFPNKRPRERMSRNPRERPGFQRMTEEHRRHADLPTSARDGDDEADKTDDDDEWHLKGAKRLKWETLEATEGNMKRERWMGKIHYEDDIRGFRNIYEDGSYDFQIARRPRDPHSNRILAGNHADRVDIAPKKMLRTSAMAIRHAQRPNRENGGASAKPTPQPGPPQAERRSAPLCHVEETMWRIPPLGVNLAATRVATDPLRDDFLRSEMRLPHDREAISAPTTLMPGTDTTAAVPAPAKPVSTSRRVPPPGADVVAALNHVSACFQADIGAPGLATPKRATGTRQGPQGPSPPSSGEPTSGTSKVKLFAAGSRVGNTVERPQQCPGHFRPASQHGGGTLARCQNLWECPPLWAEEGEREKQSLQ